MVGQIRVLLPFYDMFNHASREDGGATVMFAGGEMRIVLSKQIQVRQGKLLLHLHFFRLQDVLEVIARRGNFP